MRESSDDKTSEDALWLGKARKTLSWKVKAKTAERRLTRAGKCDKLQIRVGVFAVAFVLAPGVVSKHSREVHRFSLVNIWAIVKLSDFSCKLHNFESIA